MRWWPPLLHLLVLALLLPLAVLRIGAALEPATVTVAVAEGGAVVAETGGEAMPQPVVGAPIDPEAVTARPLFQPGRQRDVVVAVAAEVAEAPDRAAGLRMVGYLNDGTKPRAILALDGSGAEAVVREGDDFEGFEVRQITRDSVVVIIDDEEITVKLFDQ